MNEPEIHLSTRPGARPEGPTPTRETPFCIAVLGDFGGHEPGGADGSGGGAGVDWRPLRATPDTVVKLAGLRPPIPGGPDGGALDSLEAFHPDRLFETTAAFETLRAARTAVLEGRDPGIDLGREPGLEAPPDRPAPPEAGVEGVPPPGDSGGGLLDAIVAEAEPPPAPRAPSGPFASSDDLQAFAREAARKHTVREAPDRTGPLARLDEKIGERMGALLHEPRFRALEALWRGLAFLLSKVDTTGSVRVYLVDVPRAELERDVTGAGDLSRTRLVDLLLGMGPDAIPFPWALAVGAYRFGPERADMELLTGIAAICGTARIPWISEGAASLAGVPRGDAAPEADDAPPAIWRAVRGMPGTDHVALANPPFALRPPYGAGGGRTRRFAFEEPPSGVPWGNPAFACAAILARSFARTGRAGAPTDDLDLEIDAAVPAADGAARLTRTRLDPTTSARRSTAGLTPLIAFPSEARIRIQRVRSIAGAGDSTLRAWWRDTPGA